MKSIAAVLFFVLVSLSSAQIADIRDGVHGIKLGMDSAEAKAILSGIEGAYLTKTTAGEDGRVQHIYGGLQLFGRDVEETRIQYRHGKVVLIRLKNIWSSTETFLQTYDSLKKHLRATYGKTTKDTDKLEEKSKRFFSEQEIQSQVMAEESGIYSYWKGPGKDYATLMCMVNSDRGLPDVAFFYESHVKAKNSAKE